MTWDAVFVRLLSREGILLAVVAYVVYLAGLGVYNLYFSPLAKFPGPRLAALTTWYNAYYDLVVGGQFVHVVEELHRIYGPVVRVRPDVLAVNDPDFVDKIYTQHPRLRRER
ncbi:uncharacterized protein PV09_02612 [Verruconis gallopava]|uniref:Cytochrome P450 n=1 Tax=Verruconis gallopava TaxID=253628 RepID=A0A0D1XW24_9PEZI|nr:uncharacterized protein PV09_02612 [Verruconis gallopava]KIW06951.1 hypothetical protein PV09_02612 [Verruconis gallopava]